MISLFFILKIKIFMLQLLITVDYRQTMNSKFLTVTVKLTDIYLASLKITIPVSFEVKLKSIRYYLNTIKKCSQLKI